LNGKTPYELVTGEKPNISGLPIWGEDVFIKMIPEARKLSTKAQNTYWIRYNPDSQGHHVYWKERHSVTTEHNIVCVNMEDRTLMYPSHL